jgi:hypothetical protein
MPCAPPTHLLLLNEVVLGLSEDAVEVMLCQCLELNTDRQAALRGSTPGLSSRMACSGSVA